MNKAVIFKPTSVRSYSLDICCGGAQEQELPEEFELPINDWSKVKDQGYIRSCVAYGSSLVGEAEYYKRNGQQREMSIGYTYGNKECRGTYTGTGMFTEDAVKGLTKIGFIPNTYFECLKEMPEPYRKLEGREDLLEIGKQLCPKTYIYLTNTWDDETNANNIKRALYTYRLPVVMASDSYFTEGHCVAIYGWNKNNRFKFRNSWGKGYGTNGCATIPIEKIRDAFVLIFDEVELPFTDVDKDAWYYKSIKNATFSGLIKGIGDNKFGTGLEVKRCDVSVIISRMLDKAELSVNSYLKSEIAEGHNTSLVSFDKIKDIKFDDVPEDEYYAEAISHISSLGIIQGVGDNKFEPNMNTTRAEIATIATKVYKFFLDRIDAAVTWVNLGAEYGYINKAEIYDDVSDNVWYKYYVDEVTKLGLMCGTDENNFEPERPMLREECAAVLERLFSKVDKMLSECALID
jgi:hypothetical protein